jgi:CRP/FNR family nitrogen fixation transcriptional regulator
MQIHPADVSSDFPSFLALSASERLPPDGDGLETLGTIVSARAGTEIYGEGESATAWYRVQSGVVRTCKLMPDGRRQIEDFLFPGDFFGLETRDEHSFAAEAVTPATVVRYARPRLSAAAANNNRLAARLLDVTLEQLSKVHGRLMLLGRKTAEEKLATFLLEMLARSEDENGIDLTMSRTDIADYLGLTIETVSRTFSTLKHEGVIALPSAQHVVVLDRDLLEEISGDE